MRAASRPVTLTLISRFPRWTVALGAAGIFVSLSLDISLAAFIANTIDVLSPGDLLQGLGKSALFAVLIAVIAAVNGSLVKGGSDGVGRVTTRAVVHSISAIIVADMIFGFLATR